MTIALVIFTFLVAAPIALFALGRLAATLLFTGRSRKSILAIIAASIAAAIPLTMMATTQRQAIFATAPVITPKPNLAEPDAALVIVGNDKDFTLASQINATAQQATSFFQSLGYDTAIINAPASEISPTTDWLGEKMTQWLGGRSNVIVYIVTHGTPDQLCLRCDAGQAITASQLNGWLDTLNAERITVIIEACHSGSFIDELAAPGRVIAASADADAKANAGEFKAYFSDALFTCLATNPDLMACFDWAQKNVPDTQHPQIWIGWEN